MEKKLISVSGVDPIYNKKGKIVGWKLSATYDLTQSRLWRTIGTKYFYRRDDIFGLGYDALWKKRINLIAQLDAQRIAERTVQTR